MKLYRIIGCAVIALLGVVIFYNFPDAQFATSTVDNMESPDGRQAFRAMMRGGGVTPNQYNAAKGKVEKDVFQLRKNNQKDGALASWEELGPGQYAGRVRAIAPHPTIPNRIWVGGVSGGLWRSNNGGNSWIPKAQNMANFSITDIIIHPTNPDTMFVSTGEGILAVGANPVSDKNPNQSTPGGGIFRSFDGGDTWERIPAITDANVENFYFVNTIALDPNNPSILYAGTTAREPNGSATSFGCAVTKGIAYKIENYGDTINELYSACAGGIVDIDVRPDNSGTIFFGHEEGLYKHNVGGVYSNQSGGGGFPVTTGRVEIAFDPSVATTVYALMEGDAINYGALYKSTNSGLSWTDMNLTVEPFAVGNGNNQGWYDNIIWVDPVESDRVIIGGIEIYQSTDGGASFIKISNKDEYYNGTSAHADCHMIIEAGNYSLSARTVYFGTDGGISKVPNITNVGPTNAWQNKNGTTLNITQFYSMDVHGGVGNADVIGGAQDNGTLHMDEDITGDEWSHHSGGDGGTCRFGVTVNTTYFSRQNGRFFRKNHKDSIEFPIALLDTIPYLLTNFSPILTACPGGYSPLIDDYDNPNFIAPMEVVPQDRNQLFVAAQRLWHSADGGCTWSDESPTASRIEIKITAIATSDNGNKVAVGYDNGEVWIGDVSGGVFTWNVLPSLDLFQPISSIAINSNNTDRIIVSHGGYYVGNVRLTNDGGTTWVTRDDGIADIHVNKLLWHYSKNNWVYAATDLGIYASENGGQNWELSPHFDLNSGPVFTEFTDLKWGPYDATKDARELYASSFGRGIWKTQDGSRSDIYVNEDELLSDEHGTSLSPYLDIHDAEAVQAHGQTWHIDGGTYPTSSSVIIDKRLGELKTTGTGSVIIGQN